ncbi:Protocadherin-like wing polarity protein stan [Orchesella cincta]|uniref:Protocadherin-like wing polarity protein stan n=1 Tax=Orchesella cincta TaxID=48709 RepID=A0A1D2MV50_ORCCI|nr:Protocadherin-like wing polarity protein stan [Orchesella cincta]
MKKYWNNYIMCVVLNRKMYFHHQHHLPKKKRQRLKLHHSGSTISSSNSPSLNRNKVLMSFSVYSVCFVLLFLLSTATSFVIISDQDTPEGWILFDAHVPITTTTTSSRNYRDEVYSHHNQQHHNIQQRHYGNIPSGFHYQYRISHHKTQPWIHRIVKLDKDGLLQLKKSISNCQFTAGLYPSTFLVYIDIVARYKSTLPEDDHGDWDGGGENSRKISRRDLAQKDHDEQDEVGDELASNYDYISFPVTIILKRSSECHNSNNNNNLQGKSSSTTTSFSSPFSVEGWKSSWNANNNNHDAPSSNKINNVEEDVSTHVARSVDDIYVSLPLDQDNHCHHTNERIANVFHFLPASVRAQCSVKAEVVTGFEHTFGIQQGTLDIVLLRDWCLFDVYQTIQLLLRLNCTGMGGSGGNLRGLPEKVMAWDQMVHLILHQPGANNPSLDHHPIHRIRREMRNQAPYFDQPLYIAAVPEEQPAGITVTTIGATDPENQPLTYSMTSLLDARSQQFFSLDSKSGVVQTTSRLDRERMDVHYFRIVATDSGVPPRTGTGTLQINVLDSNDHDPNFEQSQYSVSIREGLSVGSTVLSVRATDQDADKNGELFYSILNPHDIDDTFRIESSSGVISTKLTLDREKRDEYTLLVQATDLAQSQAERKTATATVRIEILDDNDNYPKWTQRSYNVSVPENLDATNYPVISTVSATDADEGVNAALRYSIIGGNNQNHFSIDSLTGEVSLIKTLDYEATRSFRLNIRAIDNGNPTRSNNTQLVINVIDENDNAPKFYSQIFQETVQENLPISSSVLRIQAFDPDDGPNAKIYYRINYQENPEKFPFDIEAESGWIKTVRELDREEQSRYDFDVIAADSGDIPLSSTASVVITVQDQNDNVIIQHETFSFTPKNTQQKDPHFSPKLYESQVSEEDSPGTPVVTVKATDPDENSRITYEITEGNLRNRFSISTQNGVGLITIAQPLDFKSERKFVLTVKATDSGGRTDVATVYVDVIDANTFAPVFQNTPYSVKIFEDVPIGTTVLAVNAVDQDSGINAQIVYTLLDEGDGGGSESDNAAFMIDSNSGAITTTKLLDREKVPGYILTVVARDRGIPPMSDTTDVEIVINDVNDYLPVFEKDFYQAKVDEDVPVGTSILQVQASPFRNNILHFMVKCPLTKNIIGVHKQRGNKDDLLQKPAFYTVHVMLLFQDGDQGKNSIVRYSFSTFSDGDGTFTVDPASGVVRTVKPLDREQVSRYDLMVLATDQGSPQLTGRTNVTITILDKNDSPPMFESDRIRFFIPENSPLGSTVGKLTAWDPDEGVNAQVIYSIVGGVDANSFTLVSHPSPTVNGQSGGSGSADILTRIELDYESSRKKYDIIVRAASPPLRNDVHVEIHITDVNDNAPMIQPQFFVTLNNYKDHFPVGPIGRVPAVDADISDKLQYTILTGNKANLVYLNESTGMITLSPYLDTNVPLMAKMDVLVSDGLNEARSEMILQTHYITDELLFNSVTIQLAEMTTEAFLSPLFHHFQQAVALILNSPKENIVIFSVQSSKKCSTHPVFTFSSSYSLQSFILLVPFIHSFFLSALLLHFSSFGNANLFQEEVEGNHGILNVSLSARKPNTLTEEYFSPHYIKERVFLNRITLSKLATVEYWVELVQYNFKNAPYYFFTLGIVHPYFTHETLHMQYTMLRRVNIDGYQVTHRSLGKHVLPFSDDLCLREPCLNFEECLVVLKFRNVSNFVPTDTMLFRSVYPWQTFACRCPPGYTGLREHYLCDAEINLCFSSPCRNGGTCFRRERGYSCVCPSGFTGPSCEIQLELDTCQPNICGRGSTCTPRVRGGFLCQNCSRNEYVNSLCELTARSFSRGAFLTFPGLKDRYRTHIKLSFATQQKNGMLLYNGRYNERFDFIALEVLNSTVRFSFSLGSSNLTYVDTGKSMSDGLWHTVEVSYSNQTATVSVDDCDIIMSLENPDEFPPSSSCAGKGTLWLEPRCRSLTESCQRFLDLTGPLYIGGLPAPNGPTQIQTHDFVGCIKNVYINHKFLDLNNYVMEHGTSAGCPEKKNFCATHPCKNGGKCSDGWGTYYCQCPDGFGQKDCSEDAKPVWSLRDENSYLVFIPQLRPIGFPWYTSLSVRTVKPTGTLMSVKVSSNETIKLTLDNGVIHYFYEDQAIPVSLPRIHDGHWHHIEAKWMTAEIWFSLDYGQFETTAPFEEKVKNLHISQVTVGHPSSSVTACVQDVRVGSAKNYLRKTTHEKNVNEGCSLATACVGAVCPPRSTCVEQGGRPKCQCDAGYVGVHCIPICDLKPCKNNGSCVLDLTTPRGYHCKCDERYYRGKNCEKVMELTCPTTWWGWPVCGPCSCPADKNYSPECNKTTGQCKCKASPKQCYHTSDYHYEKDGVCKDCQCYTVGSLSKNCDLQTGRCQCRAGVLGNRCDTCASAFAEVTLNGCELVRDGCPRALDGEIWWPRAKFSTNSVHDCPSRSIGLATRECRSPQGWAEADLFNCTSTRFVPILNIVNQLDSRDLSLSPLLSTKLAADLSKALNDTTAGGSRLFGNDISISQRLITHLIQHETKQKGLNLSHRQDKNFVKNLITATGRITSKEYSSEWARLKRNYGAGADNILRLMERYLAHLVDNQEDTYTKPFELITSNLVMGLDTVELTWDNDGRKNFEDLTIESSYDLYEVTTTTKRAVRFPKYDNVVMDPRRYTTNAKIIIPLDILGLHDEKDMAGNAVVGYLEYYSLWDVLPKQFKNDVDRRFNSQQVAAQPIISLSVLASRLGLVSGKQSSPIRIKFEIFGRYIDSSNPQCVIWDDGSSEEPTTTSVPGKTVIPPTTTTASSQGWTTLPCITQVEENYLPKMGNVMTVNCTCWHLSTFAVLLEDSEIQDVPRPSIVEDIVTYVAFSMTLLLIFLALYQPPLPTLHKHLLLSIFGAVLFYFVAIKLRMILVQNDAICRVIAIGLHVTWLATFAWLLSSAIHLRRMFTEVRDVNHGSALFYFALGYAFPLLCVALSLGVRAHHYGNKFFCWLSLYEGIVWGMVGPILICVVATLATFLVAVRAAFTLKDQVVDSGNMRTLLWMDLTLLPICGMCWALCLLGANERNPVWQYAIAIAVSVLGLYIALGYCVLNQRVKESLYIRAGGLFQSRDNAQAANVSRSALAYRNEFGGTSGREDFRRDIFRGVHSLGVSTASTTSRSTTKTSSSPYRSDGFNGYGSTLPHLHHRGA